MCEAALSACAATAGPVSATSADSYSSSLPSSFAVRAQPSSQHITTPHLPAPAQNTWQTGNTWAASQIEIGGLHRACGLEPAEPTTARVPRLVSPPLWQLGQLNDRRRAVRRCAPDLVHEKLPFRSLHAFPLSFAVVLDLIEPWPALPISLPAFDTNISPRGFDGGLSFRQRFLLRTTRTSVTTSPPATPAASLARSEA